MSVQRNIKKNNNNNDNKKRKGWTEGKRQLPGSGFHINIMRGLCTFLVGLRGTSAEPLNCLFIRFGRREITIRPFADLPIKYPENANRKPSVVFLYNTTLSLRFILLYIPLYTVIYISYDIVFRIILFTLQYDR